MHIEQLMAPKAQTVVPGSSLRLLPGGGSGLEFDATDCWYPHIVWVAGDIFAVTYQNNADQGAIATFNIQRDGTLGSVIDTGTFIATIKQTISPIIRVSGNVFAICYQDSAFDGWVCTITINSDGTIGTVIDTLEFNGTWGGEADILHISGDFYAIAYRSGNDCHLCTVEIDSAGNIAAAVTDTLQIATGAGDVDPSICHISGNFFAIAYTGSGNDGWVATVEISTLGIIAAAITDSYEFDATRCYEPHIRKVSGTYYAVAYSDTDQDGKLVTFVISNTGVITKAIVDTLEFNTTYARYSRLVNVSGTLYAIFYAGTGPDGWMATMTISTVGIISDVIQTLEWDTSSGNLPRVVAITTNVYAIVYRGPDGDGWATTVRINT